MKLLCTGDWHYGATNHTSIDSATQLPTRLIDTERAIKHVFSIAEREKCTWIIVAGDIFHVKSPPSTYTARFIRLFRELLQSHPDIGVLMFPGNHDYNGKTGQEHATSAVAEALKHEENFTYTDETSTFRFKPSKTFHVVPHGCKIQPSPLDPDEYNILLCHTTFEGAKHGAEETLLADQAREIGELTPGVFDLIVSGHIHKPQGFTYKNHLVFYPGSIERVDFGERAEEKSVLVIDLDANGSTQWKRHPIPDTRPFIQIDLAIDSTWRMDRFIPPDVKGSIVKVVVSIAEDDLPNFKADAVRNRLLSKGADFVTGFQMKVDRNRHVKDAQMTESLTLDAAFERYVDRNVGLDNDMRDEINEVGRRIIREASGETS